jgi:NADP-dependent 3-hydroxy acid dehydrogenase YdfG
MHQQGRRHADPTSILITGASSGIGAALARAYAAPGLTLFLGGRDGDRLASVVETCRRAGAETYAQRQDVTDREAMASWIRACDERRALDLVIANAGISAGTGGAGEADEQIRRLFAVNLDGVLNTSLPAIERMRPRRHGQVALMSSLAAFRGFPGAPAYCASKAAVRVYGEGLRAAHAGDGVRVSVICPGFVRSRMTDGNAFRMPFLIDAGRAAQIIQRGLARNRSRIAFPWPMYAASLVVQAMPSALAERLGRALPAKD